MRYLIVGLIIWISLSLMISCSSVERISIRHLPDVDEVYLSNKQLFHILRNNETYDSLSYDTTFIFNKHKYSLFGIDDYYEECQIYYIVYDYKADKISRSDYISFLNLYSYCPKNVIPKSIAIINDSLFLEFRNNILVKSNLTPYRKF